MTIFSDLNIGGPVTSLAAATYVPPNYTYGTFINGVPATLAAFYGTLTAAKRDYPFATALTNYVDRCALQASLNAAAVASGTTGFTPLNLPSCSIYLDAQITWDMSKVGIVGTGATNVYTQACGTTPAFAGNGNPSQGPAAYGNLAGQTVLKGVNFYAFNSGYVYWPNTAGTALAGATTPWNGSTGGYYYTGSSALQLSNADNFVVENCTFQYYDEVHKWANGYIYIVTFRNCHYQFNNKAVCIDGQQPTAFEGMRWIGGITGNNNYGVYFNLGNGASGSLFVEDMSIDYNVVWQIWFDTINGTNDCHMPVYVTGCHIETNSTVSGTTSRIYASGLLFLTSCNMDEEGTFPAYFIQPSFYTRVRAVNNVLAGTGSGGTYIPLVGYNGTTTAYLPTGYGNVDRYGSEVVLFSGNYGNLVGEGDPDGFNGLGQSQNASYTLNYTNQLNQQRLTSGGTITIPVDSGSFQPMVGSKFSFITEDSSTWTFATTGTLASVGTGNTFGGKAGKIVELHKIGASSYLACLNMT